MGRALSSSALRILATAGPGEGRGHLARALALAEAADELGIATSIALARGEPSEVERGRADAAGVEFETPETLRRRPVPLVVDLPDPNDAGSAALEWATVFDDSHLLAYPVRVVVQPSLPTWAPTPGARAGRTLVGYVFAPLGRSVLRAAVERRPRHDRATPRVIVCFGGSDPHDVTARLGGALTADPRWSLDLVVGPDYRGTAETRGLAVRREPPDLVARLAAADVAVLGAGTMKFEAAALGVPAVLVAVTDDQVPVGPPFAATGAAAWAGDGRRVDPATVVALVAALALNPGRCAELARRGPEVVPGDGARRIVAATMTRPCTEDAE